MMLASLNHFPLTWSTRETPRLAQHKWHECRDHSQSICTFRPGSSRSLGQSSMLSTVYPRYWRCSLASQRLLRKSWKWKGYINRFLVRIKYQPLDIRGSYITRKANNSPVLIISIATAHFYLTIDTNFIFFTWSKISGFFLFSDVQSSAPCYIWPV